MLNKKANLKYVAILTQISDRPKTWIEIWIYDDNSDFNVWNI